MGLNQNDYYFFSFPLKKEIYYSWINTNIEVLSIGVAAQTRKIQANTLESGKEFVVFIGTKTTFGFAKTDDNPGEDDLLPIVTANTENFIAPDPTVYPYVYVDNKHTAARTCRVYKARVWTESDGTIAGVKRIGTTADRPTGYDIYVGFEYFDTSISPARPIYASAISGDTVTWVDATGAPV